MIKVRIIGGLGNQMFQYAAAKSLAIRNNSKVSANVSAFSDYKTHPLRINELNCDCEFDYKADIKYKLLDLRFFGKFFSKVLSLFNNFYVEKELPFDRGFFDFKDNSVLVGYFQSEKYFDDIRELLLKEFTLKSELEGMDLVIAKQILNTNSIAIHVRRGDYVSVKSANDVHGVCGKEYFEKALSHMERLCLLTDSSTLFVFSDDILWCKENLLFEYRTVFVDGNAEKPEIDILLMSMCKHQVISNSTFSWWGAWLNSNPDKCVIAPFRWFRTLHDSTDIVPVKWVRL